MNGKVSSVVIVGGGIAGLGAAFALQEAGLKVTVLEAEAQVGGRMRSQQWAGEWIDLGAEFIADTDLGIFAPVLARLGIAQELTYLPDETVGFNIWRDGQGWPLEFTNPASFLRFGGMSWWGKLHLLRLLPAMLRQLRRTQAGHNFEPWQAAWLDDRSLADWLLPGGWELLEYALEPTFDLYTGYTPENFSRAMFAYVMTSYRDTKLFTFPQGVGYVTQKLAARLNVLNSAPVRRVEVEAAGVRVYLERYGLPLEIRADYVIMAVPGSKVAALLAGLDNVRAEFFNQVRYVPHAVQYYETSADPHIPSVFFPRLEDECLSALGYDRLSTNPERRFLRVSFKSAYKSQVIGLSEDDFLAAGLREAVRHFPHLAGLLTSETCAAAGQWQAGLPEFRPGYLRTLAHFQSLPPLPRLGFAGDYLAGPSTGAAYTSGLRAAVAALRQISPERLEHIQPLLHPDYVTL